MTMYEDRVERGMALLDRVRPGWEREIAVDRLAMESCGECILGQLYGSFGIGWFALKHDFAPNLTSGATRYGFNLKEYEDAIEANIGRFAALADAWRRAIRGRLEARAGVSR